MDPSKISRRSLLVGAIASAASSLMVGVPRVFAADTDVHHGSRKSATVALTFHGAGDDSINQSLLKACVEAKIPITVFAVGSWLEASPSLARKFADSGIELGNHTLNHKPMKSLSYSAAVKEIEGGALALKKIIGNNGVGFRPSGTQNSTASIRKAAEKAGYKNCISYDVDSLDYQDPAPKLIVANVARGIQAGSIVSLHLGHKNTVSALPGIFSLLEERKLKPVLISELIKGI